ncbi:unnamed protein product [Vitrella brassicaformis CCMP3155]|uniref:Uncharacterized protein n=2 Tax=Vitrella brassicaformis TaxID=1169539 RepID=A0A0G4ET80_VITBC|nr:unnamed protein product [Vitrella brassicaformis CCMP3155]|mmetsp:Transcript_31779/g.78797  ORF Transcript_31779/g.78797 Transcript_31779/m.78797 type:complete len:142 (+) Transcript_31779:159-584(+)|eukprot:CEM01798.1 unnamed protein product [Vitrella brassicaformis CCMP3155]
MGAYQELSAPTAPPADTHAELQTLKTRVAEIDYAIMPCACGAVCLVVFLWAILFGCFIGTSREAFLLGKEIDTIKTHDVADKAELKRLKGVVRLIAELDEGAWDHMREEILSDNSTTVKEKVARVERADAEVKQLRKRLVA